MDLRQLEVFLKVVELGSFSKASEKLYLTQPTVSAHISTLEKELHTRLIVRSSKGAFPTEEGQVLCEYAKEMLTLRDHALAWFSGREQAGRDVLTVSASTIPAQYILPEAMAAFSERYPKASFHVLHGDSQKVVQDIVSRRAELGMTGTELEHARCVFEPFADDPLVVIAPNTEKFNKLKERHCHLRELCKEPFLMRESGSGTRRETEIYLQAAGIPLDSLQIAAQMDDPEAIKRSVSQGLGISVVSKMAAAEYERFGMVITFELHNPPLCRKLYLVRHKNTLLSASARAFASFLRKHVLMGKKACGDTDNS